MKLSITKSWTVILTLLALAFSAIGVTPAHAAGVCYVNASAGGANNGASWADAYTDLQSALGASPCSEAWVAAGTYKPTGGTDRTLNFTLKNGVALYGGFVGTESTRADRDPAANLTTLSGDIGTPGDAADNSYHVVSGGGTNGTAVLDGFTITAGNANGSSPADSGGGGMYNYFSSPTLTNVTFSSNSAGQGGGGMYNYVSSPTLENVTFSTNSAGQGGGMYNSYSTPTLTNVTFSTNSAVIGGGMLNGDGSANLTNVTFSGNSASYVGGAMYNAYSPPHIRDSIFWGDSASVADAEISDASLGNPDLADSVIAGGCPSGATCTHIITTNPQLGLLANNGGYTQTMSLGVGSSAIDTGNDATCANTDQRGLARPQGLACDIGSFELDQAPLVTSISSTSANPTSASSVNFTVTFSESVTGVDMVGPVFDDFTLTTTGVTGASVTGASGGPKIYTVTVNTGIGNGTIRLDVPLSATTIIDLTGNPLASLPFTGGDTYTVNKGAAKPPSIPTLVSPANNAITTDYTPLLDWSNSTVASGVIFDHYKLQVATDAAFSAIILDEDVHGRTNSKFTPSSDLSSNIKFFWRVRAFNTYGNASNWSLVRTFRAAMLPPVLVDPIGGITVGSRKPVLDWNDVTGATKYTLQVSLNSMFTSPVLNLNVTTSTYTPLVNLAANKLFHWRIRAIGPNGPSAWSADTFHTP